MPYKFEYTHKKIPKEYDRRIKLTDEDKEEIKQLYGKISQRKLAKLFGVSRRLIVFIGDPTQKEKNKISLKLRGGQSIYYSKEKQREYTKKHRRHKKVLDDNGVLITGGNNEPKTD